MIIGCRQEVFQVFLEGILEFRSLSTSKHKANACHIQTCKLGSVFMAFKGSVQSKEPFEFQSSNSHAHVLLTLFAHEHTCSRRPVVLSLWLVQSSYVPPCGCSSTLRWPERSGEPQRDHSMTAVGHKDGHDVRPWDSYGTRPLGDSLWSCGSSLVGCKTSGSWSWDSCGSMGLRTAVS